MNIRMKTNIMKWMWALAAPVALIACNTDVEHDVPAVDAPVLVYASLAEGASVKAGDFTLKIAYDKNVFFSTADTTQITVTNDGHIRNGIVYGKNDTLTLTVSAPSRATDYTITIPEGLVTGPNQMPAPAFSLNFRTLDLHSNLVMATSPEAEKLYKFLIENYGKKTISGMMAEETWNTKKAEQVHTWTGHYPALNTFDYMHMRYSPADWINYSDISPVTNWANAGGIVSCMWHWNVPKTMNSGIDDYTATLSETEFDAQKAIEEGTWENGIVKADLETVANMLKQLKEAKIPVLWRPLHEAAGQFFWWGKDAESFKALWKMMFTYFKEQGLDNLIWVWTSENKDDANWYPGDEYVDIIGRDLYGKTAEECAEEFKALTALYGDRMIALTECGYYADSNDASKNAPIGNIEAQWNNGAAWSWFMPWYGNAGEGTEARPHADKAWWEAAFQSENVLDREAVKEAMSKL